MSHPSTFLWGGGGRPPFPPLRMPMFKNSWRRVNALVMQDFIIQTEPEYPVVIVDCCGIESIIVRKSPTSKQVDRGEKVMVVFSDTFQSFQRADRRFNITGIVWPTLDVMPPPASIWGKNKIAEKVVELDGQHLSVCLQAICLGRPFLVMSGG